MKTSNNLIPKAKYKAKFGKVKNDITPKRIDTDFVNITRPTVFQSTKVTEVRGYHKNNMKEVGEKVPTKIDKPLTLRSIPEDDILAVQVMNVNTRGYFRLSKEEKEELSFLSWSKAIEPFEQGAISNDSGKYRAGDSTFKVRFADELNKPFEPHFNAPKIMAANLKGY